MITAPYNFIPLNKEVFYPDWSGDVSYDIPFEDGESGIIDVVITAMSPIFIRNHYQNGDTFYKNKKGDKISKEFCYIKMSDGSKQYYIPGTSIKGMTRSVLEILSFSKISFMQDSTLNVRDMSNQKELVGAGKYCGFLVKSDDSFEIQDCGKPRSISFGEVQRATNVNIRTMKTAAEKYKAIGVVDIAIKKDKKMMTMRDGTKLPKDIALFDPSSSLRSRLVLTGTINDKKNEFVFIKNNQSIKLNKKVVDNFKAAYFHEDSVDGQYWENQWKKNEPIPVFYSKNRDGTVEHIGLTQLFKLAYTKTLRQAAKQNTDDDKLDLAQCIFGTEKESDALKGRVQFSHMKSSHVTFEQEKSEILGEPNPTYYPNYIRQTDTSGNKVRRYKTLMDDDAEISGWKRYPLHQHIVSSAGGNENEDVRSKFKPLSTDTVFNGKIRFHNLKKAEIGALLSAITFHGQEESHMHNIGMAKSLGYGKISIDLKLSEHLKHVKNDYLDAFEKTITHKINNWKNSPQLKELFAMSNINCKSNESLAYQLLENPNPKYKQNNGKDEKNDFTGAKKEKEYLLSHSGTIVKDEEQKKKPLSYVKPDAQLTQPKKTVETAVAVYTMPQIAKEVSASVQEVIEFSVGLHFGKLVPTSTLKVVQANDLIKKMRGGAKEQSINQIITAGISKSKMRKAILAYWDSNFSIFYHPNQIKEFFSEEGFTTTPPEQAEVYIKNKENTKFLIITKMISLFNDGKLDVDKTKQLYGFLEAEWHT